MADICRDKIYLVLPIKQDFTKRFLTWTILATLRLSLSMLFLQNLQEERPDFAYSALYGRSSAILSRDLMRKDWMGTSFCFWLVKITRQILWATTVATCFEKQNLLARRTERNRPFNFTSCLKRRSSRLKLFILRQVWSVYSVWKWTAGRTHFHMNGF